MRVTAPGRTLGTAAVTGGAGFIGSHLVDALLDDGVRVVAIDDLSTGRRDHVSPAADLVECDITDGPALRRVIDACRPDAIFHLAAQSSVTVSVTDPGRDCLVNVLGTLNVLEAAGLRRAPVVFSSTGGALYGNRAPLPTREDWPPAPVAPYGASKWAGEAYVKTWAEAGRLPHVVCRLGNVYGPRQNPRGEAGVVAIISFHLWEGTPPTLYGHGEPTRDYIHVSDVVSALVRAAHHPRGGTFNIATGVETPVREVFARLAAASGRRIAPRLAPLREGELERSCLDPSLANDELGWRATLALGRGLEETYAALVNEFRRDAEA